MKDPQEIIFDAILIVCLFKQEARLHPVLCTDRELSRHTPGIDNPTRNAALQQLRDRGQIRRGRTINNYYYLPINHKEMETKTSNPYHEALKKYLDEQCQQDAAFAAKYQAKVEKDGGVEKSTKACGDYIASEVMKQRGRKCWTDPEIYGLALHDYDEGLDAPKNVPRYDVVVTKPELTEADRERLEEEARKAVEAEYQQKEEQRLKDEREKAEKRQRQAEERARAAEQRKREALEAKRKAAEAEATLFCFDDEED